MSVDDILDSDKLSDPYVILRFSSHFQIFTARIISVNPVQGFSSLVNILCMAVVWLPSALIYCRRGHRAFSPFDLLIRTDKFRLKKPCKYLHKSDWIQEIMLAEKLFYTVVYEGLAVAAKFI